MNVKYIGPSKDYSGYGETSRHHIAALDAAGVHVIPETVRYSVETSDYGSLSKRIKHVYEQSGDYAIKLLHTTPNVFHKHIEKNKYNIGFMYWETDKLPHEFIEGLSLCDEIWTACEANKQAILSTGLSTEIKVIPQPIEVDREWGEPYVIDAGQENFDGFLFYSIFEWIDRKNPEALLNAYWNAFQNDENVGLVIKTYFRDFSFESKRSIRNQIERFKNKSGLKKFPPVFLYLELMDRHQIARLHTTGDCYVSAHRGEGWGVPQVEAALAEKPMISTGYGGCHEYFTDGVDAFILDYTMTPVRGMEHSSRWYTRYQNWAEVDIHQMIEKMQFAYKNQQKMKEIGKNARKTAEKSFNLQKVGEIMAKRLKEIEGAL